MVARGMRPARLVLVSAALVATSVDLVADEVRVMTTRAVAVAYRALAASFARDTPHSTVALATETGFGPESIPSRVRRGDAVDVVILAAAAIDDLIKEGHIVPGSRVDLARSGIGMVVRAGATRPDISTVDGLRRTLLDAKSIAYSAQVSGAYVSTDLAKRLGIVEQMQLKGRRVENEGVADVVARGEAEIGFQQISELLGVPGTEFVGPLPPPVQLITVLSAGIGVTGRREAARELIELLVSPQGQAAMKASGLEPLDRR